MAVAWRMMTLAAQRPLVRRHSMVIVANAHWQSRPRLSAGCLPGPATSHTYDDSRGVVNIPIRSAVHIRHVVLPSGHACLVHPALQLHSGAKADCGRATARVVLADFAALIKSLGGSAAQTRRHLTRCAAWTWAGLRKVLVSAPTSSDACGQASGSEACTAFQTHLLRASPQSTHPP